MQRRCEWGQACLSLKASHMHVGVGATWNDGGAWAQRGGWGAPPRQQGPGHELMDPSGGWVT